MAFDVADFEDLLRLLEEHPEWRARLRPVILGEEILQIPARMDRVEAVLAELVAAQQRTSAQIESLAERMGQFELRMSRSEIRFDRMEGRLSNLEGSELETRYERQLGSWFSRWLRKPERISTGELDLDAAQERGLISSAEAEEVSHLDLIVRGLDKSSTDGSPLVLAAEVSYTINREDVERAAERAKILRRAGLRSRAFVGGYRIADNASELAEKLEVIVDLRRPAA